MSVLERELDHELDPDEEERSPWEALARVWAALRQWLVAAAGFGACIGLPAVLAWLAGAGERFDVLGPVVDPALPARLGRLGVFLSVVAAIVTTQSLLWLGRPLGIGQLIGTSAAIGVALFPFLASAHGLPAGLSPEQIAVAAAYAYLVLRVAVGILVGGIVAWVLIAHLPTAAAAPRRLTPRK
jgi:hypothetical protein